MATKDRSLSDLFLNDQKSTKRILKTGHKNNLKSVFFFFPIFFFYKIQCYSLAVSLGWVGPERERCGQGSGVTRWWALSPPRTYVDPGGGKTCPSRPPGLTVRQIASNLVRRGVSSLF